MRLLTFVLFFAIQTSSWSQLHNRLVKLNIGISNEQIDLRNQMSFINDTSVAQFEFVSQSPLVSYTHEIILGDILSITGRAGFQYFNIFYDNQHFGSPYAFLSVGPQFSLIYRKRFEYYMKFQIGLNYWFNSPEILHPTIKRLIPYEPSVFTGVTLVGLNYYLNDNLGLNFELSIWQPELITLGVSYRFYRGEKPSIQELQGI